RRHPDIKVLRKPRDVERVAALQAKLLDALWPLLAPGGRLLYAACSVLARETGRQIDAFVARTADAVPGRTVTVLPGRANMDGFYRSEERRVGKGGRGAWAAASQVEVR